MKMNNTSHQSNAWFRQFWPWFLIVMPGTTVIAGIVTVIIAFSGADDVVNDQWDKQGILINQRLAQDDYAKQLQLIANLSISENSLIKITLNSKIDNALLKNLQKLTIFLEHPATKALDQTVILQQVHDGQWASQAQSFIEGRYYVTIEPADQRWRLRTVIQVAPKKSFSTLIHA